jgi:methylmalonyl-CoA mutase N-terminal domain/subunit
MDETLALPTQESAEIALRTQQVLAEETGVINVADPLGGSWYIEALTDKIEAEVVAMLDRIEELGGGSTRRHAIGPITSGLLLGIEEGWFTGQIADSAFRYQTQLEKGDKKIVGVNVHTGTGTKPLEILRVSHEIEIEQSATLNARRAARDNAAVEAAIGEMIKIARSDGNMMESMLAAARAEATLGEVCNALRAEWGEYVEPARF